MAKFALCIGINDYPGTDSDLSGCVNDVSDWASALKKRGFAVTTMLDKQATGKAIRTAIAATVAKAKSGDLVVVQYSGHGSFVDDEDGDEPDGTDECICPHDIKTNGPITDDELFRLYSDREAGSRLVVISDSCHSGTVAKFAPLSTPPSAAAAPKQRRLVRFLPPAAFLGGKRVGSLGLRRMRRGGSAPGRYAGLLLAGCQDTEFSYDAYFNGRPNGAFTFVALRELDKLGASSSYATWFKRIKGELPSQQYPQSPNIFGTSEMRKWKVFT